MKVTIKKSPDRCVAIILAAGQGRRLMPLTTETPKCLININGLPILHRQLAALEQYGIRNIIIVVGFYEGKIREYTASHFPNLNFQFVDNPKFAETNTLYSLALASECVPRGVSVFQLNGDVVFDANILKMLKETEPVKSCAATVFGACKEEEIKISVDKRGAIMALNKKIEPREAIGEAVGINKFSPGFFKELSRYLKILKYKHPKEYFEYAIESTIASNKSFYPLNIGKAKAVEIDFIEDLENVRRIFKFHGS